MSATIVRIEGEIILEQEAQLKLKLFLKQQDTPHILVVTALPELALAIERDLAKVHEPDYSQALLNGFLESLESLAGEGRVKDEFRQGAEKLTGLLKGIHLTGDYSIALRDQVFSYGELLTAHLVIGKLHQNGNAASLRTPEQLGLQVTADYGNATFTALDHPGLLQEDGAGVIVVPGSYGISPQGRVARAGKSAADYTAAFLAGQLGAGRLVLWNLRVEFTGADPEIVPEAGTLRYLTYAEASELSYFDHYDFHPRTVEPLQASHIPIHILHAFAADFHPGTIINSEEHPSNTVVKSIASTDDLAVLKLNGPGVGLKPGILARITGKLAERGINIKSVITSQVSINILLGRKDGQSARKIAGELGFTAVSEITLLDEVTLVAIVGHGMQDHYGISAKLFTAVAENKINVILSGSGASDLVSYLVIRKQDKEKCIRATYQAFLKS